MKTLKETKAPRMLIIGALVVLGGFFVMAVAPSVREMNEAVNKDVNKIALHQDQIAFQKQQLKESKAKDDEAGAIVARKELCQAKADLKRDKAYLKADKKALIQLRENEMKPTAATLKENKHDLCAAKRQLKKDMRQGNTSALVDDAQIVAQKQRAVNSGEAKLNRQEEALDNKLAAIDNQVENGTAANTDQTKFAWNATASTDKTFYEPKETLHTSAVLEK